MKKLFAPERLRLLVVSFVLSVATAFQLLTGAHAAGQLAVDVSVVKHQTPATSVTSPAFSTSQTNELLAAFVAADGPSSAGGQTVTGVTGGALTWQLRQRTNTQYGTAEIWQAKASAKLTNVTVKATLGKNASSSLVVTSFSGAELATNGAVASANGATGAPTVNLTTTRPGSWVWGVGNDWSNPIPRTVGANQTKVDEYMPSAGDTYWVQRQTNVTPASGTVVTLNDTAPTTDRWNFSAIEILPAVVDTTPPSVPGGVTATAAGPNRVNVAWTASTDDVGVAGYQVLRDGSPVGNVSTTSFSDISVAPATDYAYTVRAFDAAGNMSASSLPAQVTTPPADTTPPVISAVSAGSVTQTSATVTWTTDETSDSQVEYGTSTSYGSSTPLSGVLVTNHSVSVSGLTASTQYHFRVKSKDASGNLAVSPDATFTTSDPVADTTSPTVGLTAPTNGATVSGTVNVTANASDNIGVVGVQFKLDGANLGSEDTASPYAANWDTTLAASGTHTLSAVARDAAGNTATAATVTVTVDNGGTDPSQIGQWSAPVSLPAVAIHSALLTTGKILFWQGDFSQGGQQYVFDPVTNTTTQVPNALADLFCAGQAVTADGRVLVIGGTSTSGGLGVKDITAFNQNTETWQNLAPMSYARWYATGTTLADGKVLVTSGDDKAVNDVVATPELYSPNTNSWQSLTNANHSMPVYPFIYQLTDGRIVHLGGSEEPTTSEIVNLANGQWSTFDSRVIDGGSIANYAPNKFIKAGSAADDGGSGNSANTAYTLDMNQSGATWQPTSSMQYPRSFLNLTNLPDGTVLATGGDTDKTGFNDAHGVLPAEDWDPATGQWKTLAAMSVPRLYHSVATLLPDGRVFVAGGGGDPGVPDHKDAQIYSPAYLFKGPRPTITAAPDTVQYNTNTFIKTPDAANVTKVTLIRTGSVTHAFDENARMMQLDFTATADGLNVQMPQNGNHAPPGYYMLSIVNGNGVPSISSFVRFAAPYEDSVAPTAPTNLTATGSVGQASLSWTAATDNVGVTQYNVYRSTVSGFTPDASTKVGQTANTTYVDTAPAGTYYYKVLAQDSAGNLSPESNEASVTIAPDTSPPTAPTGLSATATSASQVNLTWTAASDNVGVAGYQIWRNGVQVGTTATASYADNSVSAQTAYTYTVRAYDAAGNVSADSTAANVTTPAVTSLSLDKVISTHQTSAGTSITSSSFSTTQSNELLVAFLASDGGTGQAFTSVTGGGLTWTLRQRANTQAGTAEIWQAVAPNPLTNVTVTAQRSGNTLGSMTIAAFVGADTTANGATAAANASSGAPTVSLTTTRAGSWVWGVGDDWDQAITRTVGANQTKVDEYLAASGDTFWLQRLTNPTLTAGTLVTLNDTAPTTDRWNFAAIEIRPSS